MNGSGLQYNMLIILKMNGSGLQYNMVIILKKTHSSIGRKEDAACHIFDYINSL